VKTITKAPDALKMLKTDHDRVKKLFKEFEKSKGEKSKRIARQAIEELKVHAAIEDEIFYPHLRKTRAEKDLMNEAVEEHHVAKVLIAELEDPKLKKETFEAKFTVLAESVRHHIKEEEEEMFAQARKAKLDLAALGARMAERKKVLMKEGVPPTPEEKAMHPKNSLLKALMP
jgi:hypothetical protein